MSTARYSLVILGLLAALAATAGPKQKVRTMKTLNTTNPTISKDLTVTDDKAWLADCKKA